MKPIQQCQKKKENNKPCQATPMNNSLFCFFHDPATTVERKAAQRAGGIERSKICTVLPLDIEDMPLKTVRDVVSLLATTINQVRKGQIDARISNAVGYLSGILLKGLEQSDTEKRLASMEAIVQSRTFQTSDALLDYDADDSLETAI